MGKVNLASPICVYLTAIPAFMMTLSTRLNCSEGRADEEPVTCRPRTGAGAPHSEFADMLAHATATARCTRLAISLMSEKRMRHVLRKW